MDRLVAPEAEQGHLDFTRKLIAFRKGHPITRRDRFFTGAKDRAPLPDIQWYGPNGKKPDWDGGLAVSCLMDGSRENTGLPEHDDSLYIMFNSGEEPSVFLVPLAPGRPWALEFTTAEHKPAWTKGQAFIQVENRSVTVLLSAWTR